jgi:Concanavalin A-like lectin/glucanases superfamily
MIPSLADYAMGDDSAYPELWKDCVFATCPSLGITGGKLFNLASGEVASITTYSAARWSSDSGLPHLTFSSATNQSVFWDNFAMDQNSLSVSAWVKASTQTSDTCLLSVGTTGLAFRLIAKTTGVISAQWSTTSIVLDSTSTVTDKWTHVLAQRSRGNGRSDLFINGVREATSTASISTTALQTVLSLGARRDSGVSVAFFGGSLDDIRVCNSNIGWDGVRLLASQRGVAYISR